MDDLLAEPSTPAGRARRVGDPKGAAATATRQPGFGSIRVTRRECTDPTNGGGQLRHASLDGLKQLGRGVVAVPGNRLAPERVTPAADRAGEFVQASSQLTSDGELADAQGARLRAAQERTYARRAVLDSIVGALGGAGPQAIAPDCAARHAGPTEPDANRQTQTDEPLRFAAAVEKTP